MGCQLCHAAHMGCLFMHLPGCTCLACSQQPTPACRIKAKAAQRRQEEQQQHKQEKQRKVNKATDPGFASFEKHTKGA